MRARADIPPVAAKVEAMSTHGADSTFAKRDDEADAAGRPILTTTKPGSAAGVSPRPAYPGRHLRCDYKT
jgi:hypothetical protein